jgi:serine carboxypeptidase-like clade 4
MFQQMADELYIVITTVLSTFNHLQKLPFYAFGESYAGHWIPAISERILIGNRERQGSPVNMQGLAIGNGMTFPLKQYSKYADFSLAHGLISQQVKDQLDQIYTQCAQQLKTYCIWCVSVCCSFSHSCPWRSNNPNASDTCNSILGTVQQLGGNFNVYDVTTSCLGNLCNSGLADVSSYLNRADVLAALHVNPNVTKWQVCFFVGACKSD